MRVVGKVAWPKVEILHRAVDDNNNSKEGKDHAHKEVRRGTGDNVGGKQQIVR